MHRSSRRDFLQRAAAGVSAALFPMPAIAQDGAGRVIVVGGGFAGATCARALKKIDPRLNVTLVEASRTFTACPFSNNVIVGLRDIKAQAVRLRKTRGRWRGTVLRSGFRYRCTGPNGDAGERYTPGLRPPGACARHRHPLGRPCRLHRERGRSYAACVEGRRADAAAAPSARGHGRWRPGGDVSSGQSVPLPAGTLRARESDRVLPQDQEAEVEADHPGRQGRLLQTTAVPECVEGALSRLARMGLAILRGKSHSGRAGNKHARD